MAFLNCKVGTLLKQEEEGIRIVPGDETYVRRLEDHEIDLALYDEIQKRCSWMGVTDSFKKIID